jgi:hypothetical protein
MDQDSGSDERSKFTIPFLVGVVGHRDLVPEEVPAIRAAVERLLRSLRDAQPEVRVQLLSPLAAGADLLAAEVAQELGIDVVALLPLPAAQCREDIEDAAARGVFDRLLQRAERLELPLPAGADAAAVARDAAARDRQFQGAGALVARYSSLLIVIWDGRDTDHPAGTARVVDYRRRNLPPAGAEAAGAADLLLAAGDNDLTYEIRCSRRSAPGGAAGGGTVQVLGFISGDERLGDGTAGLPGPLATLLERTAGFNRDVETYAARIARRGRRLSPPSPYATPDSLRYVDQLFMAADWLGVHFRRCFTAALRARYGLWALLALLLLAFKKEHEGLLGLASIGGVLLLFGLGWLLAFWAHWRSWHRRYLDYRALAEGLRVDFYWELTGVRALSDGEFAHESFLQKQDYELEWIRAAMRAVSLRCALSPPVSWPHGFAHTFAAWVGDADPVNGSGQLQYYRARTRALERRQELAEHAARAMLFTGLACGVPLALDAALALAGHELIPAGGRGLLLWSLALLTVYGAIFEIYLGEKAGRALIRQYRYMDSLFSFAARELRSARTEADKLAILRSLGHACLAEHAQWILAHRDKRIDGMRW